ncbi:hypothetical protein FB45DRAFT_43817 [Roridomyces roridus]|uniref:Uncharacterized protein n=1 Tax=Roridomyces roridus TaxID=1738132 RepID=A0AAD7BRS7_9AGAR|nr:hypothetical protein FB45DRAFT_43817 [Roridomyces roridus]
MMSLRFLLLVLGALVSTVLAQCSLGGYLGAYDSTSGNFVGALARNLGSQGIFTLDQTGNRANYLAVIGSATSTPIGDAVLLQILSPVDPSVPFISVVAGSTDCRNGIPIPNGDTPFAAEIVPSDGFPLGAFPLPGDTQTTLLGGYGDLSTLCGEPMSFVIRSDFGGNVLEPVWTDQNGGQHSMIIVRDITNNRLAVTPSLVSYAAASSNPQVQQVVLAFFT